MQLSPTGLAFRLLFALLAIVTVPGIAAAQDMPPILAPLASAAETPVPASPSGQAVIPPIAVVPPVAPVSKKQLVAADHLTKSHRDAKSAARQEVKFAALTRRLSTAHAHPAAHRVAVRVPEPALQPGMVVPAPGYYPPGGPYEHLVYGGAPRGLYGGWGGYRGRYPYYP
jgi:hypothetical protein